MQKASRKGLPDTTHDREDSVVTNHTEDATPVINYSNNYFDMNPTRAASSNSSSPDSITTDLHNPSFTWVPASKLKANETSQISNVLSLVGNVEDFNDPFDSDFNSALHHDDVLEYKFTPPIIQLYSTGKLFPLVTNKRRARSFSVSIQPSSISEDSGNGNINTDRDREDVAA